MVAGVKGINTFHALNFKLDLFTSKQNLEILPIQSLADPMTLC